MELTLAQLTSVFRTLSEASYRSYLPHLNAAMGEFWVTTARRISHFLGQLGHESVGLKYMEEIADGSAYEGREDLGNVYAGDGRRYKGRGPIQLTGRANYRAAGAALGLDLEGNPARAADPDVAFRIAGWYWASRNLNFYADQGDAGFDAITYRVNGGYNGYEDRLAYYNRAKTVLGTGGGGGGRVSFAKTILAAGNDADGRIASLMQFVLAGRGVRADVVREWAIGEAHAACQAAPVGAFDFAVIGRPALEKLPAATRPYVLPDTSANRKKTDYRALVGKDYAETARKLAPALLERLSKGAGEEYLRAGGASLKLPEPAKPAPAPKPAPAKKATTLEEMVEKAIAFGCELVGTPYGTGWEEGTWPDLSPLYARIKQSDPSSYYRKYPVVCSGLINVVRYEVFGLPAVGRAQGDPYPGGTAAIGRTLARMAGSKPYPPVENTPRGWLVFSPYLGPQLALQGHVGIALGDGRVLEARVPTVSDDRTEDEGSRALVAGGGRPYTTIIPPSVWAKV